MTENEKIAVEGCFSCLQVLRDLYSPNDPMLKAAFGQFTISPAAGFDRIEEMLRLQSRHLNYRRAANEFTGHAYRVCRRIDVNQAFIGEVRDAWESRRDGWNQQIKFHRRTG